MRVSFRWPGLLFTPFAASLSLHPCVSSPESSFSDDGSITSAQNAVSPIIATYLNIRPLLFPNLLSSLGPTQEISIRFNENIAPWTLENACLVLSFKLKDGITISLSRRTLAPACSPHCPFPHAHHTALLLRHEISPLLLLTLQPFALSPFSYLAEGDSPTTSTSTLAALPTTSMSPVFLVVVSYFFCHPECCLLRLRPFLMYSTTIGSIHWMSSSTFGAYYATSTIKLFEVISTPLFFVSLTTLSLFTEMIFIHKVNA